MDVNALTSSATLLSTLTDSLWQSFDASTPASADSLFGPSSVFSLGEAAQSSDTTTSPIDLSSITSQIYGNAAAPVFKLGKEDLAALNQARSLRDSGDYDGARGILSGLLQKSANNGFAAHAMGTVAIAEQKYSEAERWFRRADYNAPGHGYDVNADTARILQKDDATVLATARRFLSTPGTADEGQGLLVELTTRSPDQTDARILLADRLIKAGDATNGLLQYRTAIGSADPEQLQRMEATLQGLAQRSPKAAFVHQLVGRVQLALGKFDDAKKTLQEASDLADSDAAYESVVAQAYAASGAALFKDHENDAAITELQQAVSIDPENKSAIRSLADAFEARGTRNEQIGDLVGAIKAFQLAQTQLNKAGTVAQKEALAADFYRVGRRIEGRHLESGQDVGQEALALQAAYDLDPTNTTYRIQLAAVRSRSGDQFIAKADLAGAVGAYRRAYLLRKTYTPYRDKFIDALNQNGAQQLADLKYSDAVNSFKEAYTTDKSNETSKFNLAGAYNARGLDYLAKGNLDLALADFKAALDLYPDNSDFQNNYHSAGGP